MKGKMGEGKREVVSYETLSLRSTGSEFSGQGIVIIWERPPNFLEHFLQHFR
jgi:hypothetical protein